MLYHLPVQLSLNYVWFFVTTWTTACQASLSPTPRARSNSSIKSVMPSNHLILCCPLLLLPSIFYSTRFFSNESVLCIRRPKEWSFSLSISPNNTYLGLIYFRIYWFDLVAVQGTLKKKKKKKKVFSNTTVQKHQFLSTQLSLLPNSHVHTWLLEKP